MESGGNRRGFTLIETLIAMAVLVSGVTAVACLYAHSTATLVRAEREAMASFLVARRMEELRGSSPAGLTGGGGLDPLDPVPGYSLYLAGDGRGRISQRAGPDDATLLLLWEVGDAPPVRIAVAVHSLLPQPGRPGTRLAYAVTSIGGRF